MKEISCTDLGIQDCDWSARGETPGDIVEQVVAHTRKHHDVDLPDAAIIMEGGSFDDPLGGTLEPAAATIIRRLREELNLQETDGTPDVGFVGVRGKSP